jgi:hypothetical protein
MFSSKLPQNRHPEAERLTDLSRDTTLYGAKSKDPEDAYLAYAVRSFSPTEARTRPTRHGLSLEPRAGKAAGAKKSSTSFAPSIPSSKTLHRPGDG